MKGKLTYRCRSPTPLTSSDSCTSYYMIILLKLYTLITFVLDNHVHERTAAKVVTKIPTTSVVSERCRLEFLLVSFVAFSREYKRISLDHL